MLSFPVKVPRDQTFNSPAAKSKQSNTKWPEREIAPFCKLSFLIFKTRCLPVIDRALHHLLMFYLTRDPRPMERAKEAREDHRLKNAQQRK